MRIRVTLAAAILALVAACSDSTDPPGGQGDVEVRDNSFSPSTQTAAVGETVTWTWTGNNQHNVTWDTGSPTASVTQASGTYQRTFAQAGTYAYHCTIHGSAGSGMHGTIAVQ